VVDVLRSCHTGRWRFYKNRPDIITSGRFYFAHPDAPCLPYPHDFYSATWTVGDERDPLSTGPIQEPPGAWNQGELDISFPPGTPFGTWSQFAEELTFPEEINGSQLRAGIPTSCWTSVGQPFVPADDVSNILNCCVRTAYAALLKWLYDAEFQKFKDFFDDWLGPSAIVTTYAQSGLLPAMAIVASDFFTLVFVTGTTNFQQLALQAFQAKLGPSSFGSFRTLQLWFDLATKISERLSLTLSAPDKPLVYAGHSYGAAGCAVSAMREKAAGLTRDIFLLTFGMPKPSDNPGIRLLDVVRCVHVWNRGDIVSQLPLNIIQSSWFPDLISQQLETRWGLWSAAPEYRIQELSGRSFLGHLPTLTADDIIDPLLAISFGQPVSEVFAHPIKEYILRSCRACRCPRWPIPSSSWNMLDLKQCGARGIRFRTQVPAQVPAHEPRARVRFHQPVTNFPAKPPLCYSLCLHAATNDNATSDNVPTFANTSAFTFAFFYKLRSSFAPVMFWQGIAGGNNAFAPAIYTDGTFYAHVPANPGPAYATAHYINDLDWHHCAYIYDGTEPNNNDRIKVYFDGVPVSTSVATAVPTVSSSNAGAMNVGFYAILGQYSEGDVRFIVAVRRRLTDGEIAKLASNTTNPFYFEPEWFVPFTEGTGITAKDYAGNGHDLTFVNSASWCGSECLPRTVTRIKFRLDVEQAGWDGPPIGIKIRFRLALHNAIPPGDVAPIKTKFRVQTYVSPIPPATRSIWLNAAYGQFQQYDVLPAMGDAFTVFFWARSIPSFAPGAVLSFSNFFPRLFRWTLASGTTNTIAIDLIKPDFFPGQTFSGSAELPVSYGWHFYCVELFDVPTFPRPAKLWVDAQEHALQSDYFPPTFTNSWFGGGKFRVGTDGSGLFKSGYYKNVGVFDGIWTQEEKEQIMTCEVDLETAGATRLFEYELDAGSNAYETITAVQTFGFRNHPAHVPDVPPFMQG